MKKALIVGIILGVLLIIGCTQETEIDGSQCYDGDDGDYFTRGFFEYFDADTGDYTTETEVCIGDTLREFYCVDGKPYSELVDCDDGCVDGACSKPQPTAFCDEYNTNEPKDFYDHGVVIGGLANGEVYEYEDSCSGDVLSEYYCDGDYSDVVFQNCIYGCENGACKKSSDGSCVEPNGDWGDFYCGEGIVYECQESEGRWKLVDSCNDLSAEYGYDCKVDGKVDSTKDNLCEEDDKYCTLDSNCNDNDACTTDSCNNNECTYSMKNCGSGKYCTDGECVEFPSCEEDSDCNDYNPATEDSCVINTCKNVNPTLNYLMYGGIGVGAIVALWIGLYFWRRKK